MTVYSGYLKIFLKMPLQPYYKLKILQCKKRMFFAIFQKNHLMLIII